MKMRVAWRLVLSKLAPSPQLCSGEDPAAWKTIDAVCGFLLFWNGLLFGGRMTFQRGALWKR